MVDRLLASLFALTLAFSAASLLVMLLREPCRKLAGSSFTYCLWLLAPLAIVAALLPALPHPAAPTLLAPVMGVSQPLQPAVVPPAPSLIDAALELWRDLTPYMIGAWSFGLVVFLCRIALLQRRFIDGLGKLTRDPGRPNVFYSEKSGVSPSVVGMLRSRIVLPADFSRAYGTDEQTLIMAHERTHVTERHPTAGALAVLIVAVQWFNPLAYLALTLFRIDQELACDAAVVTAHPTSRAAYAKAMLKARIGVDMNPPLAYCWISRLSLPMKDRISLLKSPPPTRGRRAVAVAMLTLIASGSALAAYAMVPHPEISLNFGQTAGRVEAGLSSTAVSVAGAPVQRATVKAATFKAARPAARAMPSPTEASPLAEASSVSVTTGVLGNVASVPAPSAEIDTSVLSEQGRRLFVALSEAAARGENVAPPTILTTMRGGQTLHNVRMAPSDRDPTNFDDLNRVMDSVG